MVGKAPRAVVPVDNEAGVTLYGSYELIVVRRLPPRIGSCENHLDVPGYQLRGIRSFPLQDVHLVAFVDMGTIVPVCDVPLSRLFLAKPLSIPGVLSVVPQDEESLRPVHAAGVSGAMLCRSFAGLSLLRKEPVSLYSLKL